MTAAELAAILDPEHQQKYWWTYYKDWIYYGPPDLHTAREHNWRLEDWLEARGYSVLRQSHGDGFAYTVVRDQNLDVITNNINHTAALVGAIERIVNNG